MTGHHGDPTALRQGSRVWMLAAALAVLPCATAANPLRAVCGDFAAAEACRVTDTEFDAAVRRWEQQLIEHGHRLGRHFLASETDTLNAPPRAWYYDAQYVFLQAAARLGDANGDWNRYAQRAEAAYEAYVQPGYSMPAYERFPHGLALDHARNGDPDSLATLAALRERGPFADVLTSPQAAVWYQQAYSREIAYMIDTHVAAERAGLPRQPDALAAYVDRALEHVRIWNTGEYRSPDPDWHFCQPFMAGLTASALIDYHRLMLETGGDDDRIPPALRTLGDRLIERAWVPAHATPLPEHRRPRLYGSFRYVVPATAHVGDDKPTPDLNLLIVPLYGWLWHHTGEERYRTVGDMAFIAGVHLAWLEPAKTFNQNYRNGFSWLQWRGATVGIGQ